MDAALNRFVGTADSLAPEGWTKPQYILDAIKKKRKEKRAFCPTGSGGGVKNDCSSSDKGTGDITAGDKSLAAYESFTPVGKTKNSDFISVSSDSDITTALNSSQQEKVGAHRELPAGYPIDLRIDINAYENHDTYVVTAHEHVGGAGVGPTIGYDSIIRLKGDVAFKVGETAATKIGRGKNTKGTHSTVKGLFDPSREVPSDIDSWTPVGYNPKTATYYYDKRTGKEVTGGVDSVSVGNTVFVRVPKYGNAKDPSKPPRNAKTDFRSADCGRDEGGKFGSGNDCATDGSTSAAAAPAKSSQFSESISDSNGKHDWEKGKGDPPFAGADKYAAVGISAPKQVAKSLDSIGVTPSQLLDMSGANAGGETVYVRPAPEFKNDQPFAGSGVIPLFVDFSRDIAGVKDGLGGSSVIGSKKSAITGETSLNIYHNMITVSETVRKDPVKRQTAAREFYRAMVSSVDAARKAGVTRVHLNAAGSQKDYYKGYTIWPRMGFDAPIPSHIAAKLPPDLSHAKTLLDLHATREGTRWWADNGDDVDVSLDITDRSSPQNKLFDRFSKHFGTDRRAEYPGMPSLDGWLSEEDTAKIEGVWEEIWDSDLLDDYSGEEQNFDVDS